MRAIPVWKLSAISLQLSELCFQGEEKERFSISSPVLSKPKGGGRWLASSPACC